MNVNQEMPASNSVYPGCLVSLKPHADDRVIFLDKMPKKMTTSDTIRKLPIPKDSVGVVIEVFPNAFVRIAERTWLVYVHPHMTVIEQSRLRRVSFSWKESSK